MKRIIYMFILVLSFSLLIGCKNQDTLTIRIYNSVDYIDEDVLEEFKEWYRIRNGEEIEVIYDTFETNESMYNTIRSGKTNYDLCCPSDYMIQKMNREGMLEEFDLENYSLDIYEANCSPYVKRLFESAGWKNLAACYMWGTLGIIYNPEKLGELANTYDEDENPYYELTSWTDFLNPLFKGEISLKDSVRDSYCVAQILANLELLAEYDNESLEYNALIQEVINKVSDEDIAKAEKVLREMKSNLFGLEVDSAKGDIVTGKIAMNLAWSGDAVYSIELASDEDIELKYCVPDEGGNVWFDAWVMPKGANKKVAAEFINFISQPEIAAKNMEYIGYTSPIAGDDIFNLIKEWYGEDSIDEGESLDDYEWATVDLSYFFGDSLSEEYQEEVHNMKIELSSYENGAFSTQYPSEEVLNRCGIMRDFEDQNEKVLQMWINFRANKAPFALIISLIAFALVCGGTYLIIKLPYIKRLIQNKKNKTISK